MSQLAGTTAFDRLPYDTVMHLFSDVDVQLLVTDLETDEILFANPKMNRSYQVGYNPVGKRCWEVYQIGQEQRCDFCPVGDLREGPEGSIVWEAYNTATGRWFRNQSSIIRWTDGRRAHLEQGVDITEMKNAADMLQRRLEQQQLMSDISNSFVAPGDTSPLIGSALEMVGKFLSLDRILLARIDEEAQAVRFEHGWFSPGVEVMTEEDLSRALSVSMIRDAYLARGLDHTQCADTSRDAQSDAFAALRMSAYLTVPVWVNGRLWGALSHEMSTKPRNWAESDIYLAKMVSNVISSALLREEMRRDVREAEERTKAMLDATPLACTYFDENLQIIDCNQEAPRMYGLPDKQSYMEGFLRISPQRQPDGVPSGEKAERLLRKAFETGREVFEWEHFHADGSVVPVEITLVRVRWRDRYRIAGYSRDLRELKAKMAEIERTQDDLRAAKDKAEESARAKSNFLANMSHEIRTPMNAIIGMTDIAQGSDDMERIRYCLGKVDDAANHLLGVINDILDMSKIDAGKLELSPSDFLLEKMLQRVSDITNFRAEQKRQDFIIKVDSNVPAAIVTDQQRLSQVITNLLSNAVKFTPDNGKITLLIHNVEDRQDSCKLLFEVIDTGIGLSAQQQAKLFQSFEQADGSISRRFGGTGLGLAISKNIVDLMGGAIGIESELQKGSRFYFTITVRKGTASYQSKLRDDIDWKNVNLLVVDDAPEVREYFEDISASIGVKCRTAPDGYEACRLIEEDNPYHILFIDWMMPGMDGIELTRRIREKYGDNVVVIMISVVEWEQIERSAMEAGVNSFISKPLLPSRIIDCINGCLGQREAQSSPPVQRDVERFDGKRILLAEDIEINREIIAAMLDGTGIRMESAEDGREACRKFTENPDGYDMILMDIHMPEMDGYEATRSIRSMALPQALNIPIVAMTANVFREDIDRCLAAGMDDHIGKPVDVDDLMNKLKRYL